MPFWWDDISTDRNSIYWGRKSRISHSNVHSVSTCTVNYVFKKENRNTYLAWSCISSCRNLFVVDFFWLIYNCQRRYIWNYMCINVCPSYFGNWLFQYKSRSSKNIMCSVFCMWHFKWCVYDDSRTATGSIYISCMAADIVCRHCFNWNWIYITGCRTKKC